MCIKSIVDIGGTIDPKVVRGLKEVGNLIIKTQKRKHCSRCRKIWFSLKKSWGLARAPFKKYRRNIVLSADCFFLVLTLIPFVPSWRNICHSLFRLIIQLFNYCLRSQRNITAFFFQNIICHMSLDFFHLSLRHIVWQKFIKTQTVVPLLIVDHKMYIIHCGFFHTSRKYKRFRFFILNNLPYPLSV